MDSHQRQYVLFRLGSEEYGLPIETVRSIIRFERPTPVPRAPRAVQGVVNLRGQVIPVVDLGERLLGTALEPDPGTRIIVAESSGGTVGLIVQSAHEVATILAEDVRPAPEGVLSADTAEAIVGVASRGDDRLVILLDLDHALPKAEYAGFDEESESDV